MRSLQNYIDTYNTIAKKLNLQGDSVEILTQLLANASYISEVENASYVKESSLEKATLINSKIQHCMNEMYSVFRGSCPRVIIKFKPGKYFNFNIFDEIIASNTFKVYYLGYYDSKITPLTETERSGIAITEGFKFAPITIPPSLGDESYTIIGLLAKEVVSKEWLLGKNNTYYVDCLESNLSNDLWVKVDGELFPTDRIFSEHILNKKIFDLTITDFGSRLYVTDITSKSGLNRSETETPSNTKIEATYFKYSELSGYNESELKKINLRGSELVSINQEWLNSRGATEISKGISLIPEVPRDPISTIHYKANRDRYVNSIFRSNSDVGVVLEEMYPEKVVTGGTSFRFTSGSENSSVQIYYVPHNKSNILTTDEIQKFISTRSSYFVTDLIEVTRGTNYNAIFNIDLELYQSTSVESEVSEILGSYSDRFNMDLSSRVSEIKALISKISNVKQILGLNITYTTEDGMPVSEKDQTEMIDNLDKIYFSVNYVINSIVQ